MPKLHADNQGPTKATPWTVALALVFFLAMRLLGVFLEWGGRKIPPEPDDSYHYFYHIRWLMDYGLSRMPPAVEALRVAVQNSTVPLDIRYSMANIQSYLAWSGANALLSKAFHFNPEQTFLLNFILGTVLLTYVVYRLAKVFVGSEAYVILALAAFAGAGSYHGFFWVVPSFYTLCFYFLLYARPLWWRTALIVFLLFFSHPSGFVLVLAFAAAQFVYVFVDSNEGLGRRLKAAIREITPLIASLVAILAFYFLARQRNLIPETMFSASMMRAGAIGGAGVATEGLGLSRLIVAVAFVGLSVPFFNRPEFKRLMSHITLFAVFTGILFFEHSPHPKRFFLFLVPLSYILMGLLFKAYLDKFGRPVWVKAAGVLALGVLLAHSLKVHHDFGQAKREIYDLQGFERALQTLPKDLDLVTDGQFAHHYFATRYGLNFKPHDLQIPGKLVFSSENIYVFDRKDSQSKLIADFKSDKKTTVVFADQYWVLSKVQKN